MPSDLKDGEPADFRMLTIIHAVMRSPHPLIAPMPRRRRRTNRKGMKLVLREIARPVEWLVRWWRGGAARKARPYA